MRFRRVTTHKDETGRSVFLADEWVEPLTLSFLPGVEFFRLVGGDGAPAVGPGAGLPESSSFFPGEGGFNFTISTIPPGVVRAPEVMDKRAALAEAEAKLPGLLSASEREPGMHTSQTLDLVLILAGDVTLELDDGASIDLDTGDFVVQIGARHRWHNRGTERAVILSGVIGGTAQG
ncbi:MAG: cupin domain-containing protein [Acidimicrobiia bacterium]